MTLDVIFIFMGLACLFVGGEWLVQGSSRLARLMGISPLIVGLTVVATGTSVPELMVSLNAAIVGASEIAVGNVVGSNIANIGLILGLAGLMFRIDTHISLIRREIPIMIGASLLTYLLMRDGSISSTDGLILFSGFIGFNALLIWATQRERRAGHISPEEMQEGAEDGPPVQRGRELVRLLAGLALLVVGARLTVDGAVGIAREIGISELVIGLTLVAVGTSLPELTTTIVAGRRGHSDIAVGNAVGSNISNLFLILGLTAIIQPIPITAQVINFDMLVLIGFALLMLLATPNGKISRWQGGVFLITYFAFILYSFLSGSPT